MMNQSEHQSFHGFFVVDKPKGWTSFDVVAKLRGVLGVRKIGHAGTLDPMATGVLVIGVGKAVRLFEYMSGLEKEYEAEVELGKVSDTDDAEGKISQTGFQGEIAVSEVEMALADFCGEIEQVPPAFSAVKVAGRRAYDLARKGRAVSLAARKVTIFQLRLIWYEFPKMRILVVCSGGTYIRSLARDIGRKLGCGAILTGLRRTRVGEFTLLSLRGAKTPLADERRSNLFALSCKSRRLLRRPARGWTPRNDSIRQEIASSSDSRKDALRFLPACRQAGVLAMTTYFSLSFVVKHLPRIDLTLEEFQALQKGQKIPIRAVEDARRHQENRGEIFAGFYNGELVSILKPFPGNFLRSAKNL